jgi:phospholipid/cholesterol/gamma-HCH transport system ATP-binding protein
MRKRAAIARTIAQPSADLDEPTSGLDPIPRAASTPGAFADRDLGLTVFLVTHDLDTLRASSIA